MWISMAPENSCYQHTANHLKNLYWIIYFLNSNKKGDISSDMVKFTPNERHKWFFEVFLKGNWKRGKADTKGGRLGTVSELWSNFLFWPNSENCPLKGASCSQTEQSCYLDVTTPQIEQWKKMIQHPLGQQWRNRKDATEYVPSNRTTTKPLNLIASPQVNQALPTTLCFSHLPLPLLPPLVHSRGGSLQ